MAVAVSGRWIDYRYVRTQHLGALLTKERRVSFRVNLNSDTFQVSVDETSNDNQKKDLMQSEFRYMNHNSPLIYKN